MIAESTIYEFVDGPFALPVLKDHAIQRNNRPRAVAPVSAMDEQRPGCRGNQRQSPHRDIVVDLSGIHGNAKELKTAGPGLLPIGVKPAQIQDGANPQCEVGSYGSRKS